MRDADRFRRRNNGKYQIGPCDIGDGCRFNARRPDAVQCPLASPFGKGKDAGSALYQALPDGAAHGPGSDDGDGCRHEFILK